MQVLKRFSATMIVIIFNVLIINSRPLLGSEIYRYIDADGHIHYTDHPINRPSALDRPAGEKTAALAPSSTNFLSSVKIYRFIDDDGVVHLTDRPKDDRYQLLKPQNMLPTYVSDDVSYKTHIHKKYQEYYPLVSQIAESTQMEPALLHAVIQAESAYNPNARSPKGAVGLMQLMPGTARRYGVEDRTDATSNLYGGARYLKDLLEMFNYDIQLALAGYNAGENAVKRFGYQIPPYRETRNYVTQVLALYRAHRSKVSP